MKFVEKTRRFEVLLYVCCLAIGIWLLIQQKQALNIICWVLGIALIVYGGFVTIGFLQALMITTPKRLLLLLNLQRVLCSPLWEF